MIMPSRQQMTEQLQLPPTGTGPAWRPGNHGCLFTTTATYHHHLCLNNVNAAAGRSYSYSYSVCPFRQPPDVLDQKLQQAGNCASNVPTAAQQNGINSENSLIQRFMVYEAAAELGVVSFSKAGLYISGFLGASPDAILNMADGSKKLLEVKCRATDPGLELLVDVKLQVGTLPS
jgi:hypothetical protein